MPGDDLPQYGSWDLFTKKGGHMMGYALLAVGYLRGLAHGKAINTRLCFLAVLLSGIYGASDEFHQLFISGRSASVGDVMIDTVGAVLGAAAWARIKSAPIFHKNSGTEIR